MQKQRHIPICLLLIVLGSTASLGGIDKPEKIHKLHRDIVLLNLINGLYLTPEQTESIIDKIEEAEEARKDFQQEIERRKKDVEDVLEDLEAVLLKGEEIPEDLKKRVHRMKEIQHSLENEMGEKLVRLESEVGVLLTKNQLITIDNYKPCTIPPAQGKIGQSVETAAEGMARMLTRIRHMHRDRYDLMKDMFVDGHLDRIENHLGFQNSEEKERYRQDMLDTFDKARQLSDQEFLVQKGELARKLMPEDVKIRRLRKNQLGRVGHFLLDPALIPILETKLKQG